MLGGASILLRAYLKSSSKIGLPAYGHLYHANLRFVDKRILLNANGVETILPKNNNERGAHYSG